MKSLQQRYEDGLKTMSPWARLASDSEQDPDGAIRFILDNDMGEGFLRAMHGAGASVVQIDSGLRSCGDAAVLAEAKRQRRVLVTDERRFARPGDVRREDNPGIVILPAGRSGRPDWRIVRDIISQVAPRAIEQTIIRMYANGKFTIWMPNAYTDVMEPTHGRVTKSRTIEVWVDDLGY